MKSGFDLRCISGLASKGKEGDEEDEPAVESRHCLTVACAAVSEGERGRRRGSKLRRSGLSIRRRCTRSRGGLPVLRLLSKPEARSGGAMIERFGWRIESASLWGCQAIGAARRWEITRGAERKLREARLSDAINSPPSSCLSVYRP